MGVDKSNIPESYLCELCKPRPVDLRRAIRLQIQKKERELSELYTQTFDDTLQACHMMMQRLADIECFIVCLILSGYM